MKTVDMIEGDTTGQYSLSAVEWITGCHSIDYVDEDLDGNPEGNPTPQERAELLFKALDR